MTALFLGRPLRPRHRLEPAVRNRLPALHGDTVRAIGDPLLRALDRRELVLQPFDHRAVALDLEELGAAVGRMLVQARELAVAAVRAKLGKLALDAFALLTEKLAGSLCVQGGISLLAATLAAHGADTPARAQTEG